MVTTAADLWVVVIMAVASTVAVTIPAEQPMSLTIVQDLALAEKVVSDTIPDLAIQGQL